MSRRGYIIGLAGCLAVGVVDLGLINLWLAPRGWPPGTMPTETPAGVVAGRAPAPPAAAPGDRAAPPPAAPGDKAAPPAAPHGDEATAAPAAREAGTAPPPAAPTGRPRPQQPRVGVAGPAKPAADDSDVGMSVYFARGGSALSDRARSLLEEVAGVLSRNRNLFLRLDGFTDRRSEGYNFKLSKQRCNAVRMFFVVRGIDPARISVNTVGWLVPAGGAAPRPGAKRTWKNDRRVQITLLEE